MRMKFFVERTRRGLEITYTSAQSELVRYAQHEYLFLMLALLDPNCPVLFCKHLFGLFPLVGTFHYTNRFSKFRSTVRANQVVYKKIPMKDEFGVHRFQDCKLHAMSDCPTGQ